MEPIAQVVRELQALADPRRLRILGRLAAGSATVPELLAIVPVTQPTLSRHLKVLRETGWIGESRSGRAIRYALIPDSLLEAILRRSGVTVVPAAGRSPAEHGRPAPAGELSAPPEAPGDPLPVVSTPVDAPDGEENQSRRNEEFQDWLL